MAEKKSLNKPRRKKIAVFVALALVATVLIYMTMTVQIFLCSSALTDAYVRLEAYSPQTASLSYGKMTYVDEGRGEPVLVVHGISGGYDQAFETMKDRTEDYRVIAPSRFGYPGSDMPADNSPAKQARAYAELLDTLGIDKVFVLGTSAGGTVAIRFALDFPERTKGLILYSSAAPYAEEPQNYSDYQGPPEFLLNNYAMWLMSPLFGPVMGMEPDTIYDMLPINERRDGMEIDASVTNPDMARNFTGYPIESLAVPTLIFHARDDKLASYEAMRAVVHRFPEHTFISFEDGGHMMAGHAWQIDEELDDFTAAPHTPK